MHQLMTLRQSCSRCPGAGDLEQVISGPKQARSHSRSLRRAARPELGSALINRCQLRPLTLKLGYLTLRGLKQSLKKTEYLRCEANHGQTAEIRVSGVSFFQLLVRK